MDTQDLKNVLKIGFDAELMENALQHSSMFANDKEKAELNSDLLCIGKHAINTASMISVFLLNAEITASDLLRLTGAKKAAFEEAFVKKYDVSSLVRAKNISIESAFPSVLQQIVGVLFLSNSQYNAYRFLLDILNSAQIKEKTDYKTLVLEYANRNRIQFSYEYVNKVASDKGSAFVAELKYDGKSYFGEGTSKKAASMNAAKRCVTANNIKPIRNDKSIRKKNAFQRADSWKLTAKRKAELNKLTLFLGIQSETIRDKELDVAFTHDSFFNENSTPYNPYLHALYKEIGSHIILTSTGCELFDLQSTGELQKRIAELTAGTAIEKAVDFNAFQFVRVGKGVLSYDDLEKRRIISECYKALLGAIFITHLQSGNPDQLAAYESILSRLIEKIKVHSYINYTSRLQEIAQALGNRVEYEITQNSNSLEHATVYSAQAVYYSGDTFVRANGKGRNQRTARNVAAKNLIKLLVRFQKENSNTSTDETSSAGNTSTVEPEDNHTQTVPRETDQKNNDNVEKEFEQKNETKTKKRISPPTAHTSVSHVLKKQYSRNQEIAEFVKLCAEGICELCHQPAPFLDLQGRPYLECHHVIWLSHGGDDSVLNAVALCPTCHRKVHVLNDYEDKEKLIAAAEAHKNYF